MKTYNSEINICMITDKNYILPACVAIQSIVDNKGSEKYNFYIITSNIDEEKEKEFKKLEREDITIRIISDNAEKRFNGLHNFSDSSSCTATIAALLKFVIPDLLPDLDKVLYLDSDIIVEKDLCELYNTELGENYVAAAEDGNTLCPKDEYQTAVEHYFNSGVMLLNLKKMRENNISAVLTETKRNIYDSSQVDQNILNMVFDGKVKTLPVKYNFSPSCFENISISQINLKYDTEYETKGELFSDAAIIHYSSAAKPWNEPCSALAYKWRHYYLSLYKNNNNEEKEKYGISAVITCLNDEKYIESTVKSVLEQNFEDFEIILVDCGSTDSTKEIIKKFAEKQGNITSYFLTEQSRESALNLGIQKAQGKYIHLINCGDRLEPECWTTAYTFAQENDTDLIMFEAENAINKNSRIIKDAFPKIYTGKELFALLNNSLVVNMYTGMMLAKRELLTKNCITFPETGIAADKYYIYKTITNASSVIVLPDTLYKTEKYVNSQTADCSEKEKIISLFSTILELTEEYDGTDGMNEYNAAVFKYIQAVCIELKKQYSNFEEKFGKDTAFNELGDIRGAVDVCMFIASSGEHGGLCKLTGEKYREINSKLQQTYKEKSEINAKLLQTYKEEAEINAKLQQTYKEKSEKTKQIKRLEKYSFYPMLKRIKKAIKK